MGCRPLAADARCLAAGHIQDVKARIPGPGSGQQVAAAELAVGHPRAVRREAGGDVVPGFSADDFAAAAIQAGDTNGAQVFIVPGGVDNPVAVTGKRRVILEVVRLAGQAAGFALAPFLNVDVAQSLEDGGAAIR